MGDGPSGGGALLVLLVCLYFDASIKKEDDVFLDII